MARKRFDQVVDLDTAKMRAPRKAHPAQEKDRDYTIPGIIALFGIVLLTALYFGNNGNTAALASDSPSVNPALNTAGGAITNPYGDDETAATVCEVSSHCEGSKLVRQHDDCSRFVAYCDFGCVDREDGAVCR